MENRNIRILLTMSFFSLIWLNPAKAICVPRNSTPVGPSPSPDSPLKSIASPSHEPSPSPESIPLPPSMVAPPQSSQAADADPPPTNDEATTMLRGSLIQAGGADPPPTNVEATTMLRGSLTQAGGADLAIKKLCDTTDYPALCISTLAPFLVGRALLAEPIALLQAAIKAATAETKLAMMVLGKLIETLNMDAKTLMSLKDCHDNYSDALDNFQAATDAIPNRDIGTINSMLSAAVTDYGTCKDEFSGGSSPMASHDSKLSHMADNCLAIASLIK